jgi:hypothetical protein
MERSNMADEASDKDKGFLGRWSARKVAVKEGKPVLEPESIALQATPVLTPQPAPAASQAPQDLPATPALTLADVSALTPASDYAAFIAKGVSSEVKNAAMKKLFTDPHYNIMDGLDIYIGDYSTHDVLPQSVIDEMTKDGFLNMFQKEEVPADSHPAIAITPNIENTAHDDTNLQLQRDHAAGREGVISSADQQPEVTARLEAAQPAVPPPST